MNGGGRGLFSSRPNIGQRIFNERTVVIDGVTFKQLNHNYRHVIVVHRPMKKMEIFFIYSRGYHSLKDYFNENGFPKKHV